MRVLRPTDFPDPGINRPLFRLATCLRCGGTGTRQLTSQDGKVTYPSTCMLCGGEGAYKRWVYPEEMV